MTEDNGIFKHIKGFFVLHHYWLIRYFNIIFISIILGALCGFTMVLFNYLLIFLKISIFSFFPYFISPIIAGLLTSLLVKYGKANRIMGTGAAEFVEDVNMADIEYIDQSKMEFSRKQNLFSKTLATSWTYGSGMVCGLEGPGLLIGGNIGFLFFRSGKYLDSLDAFFIGASACTGAILKAPISGALFCAELPYFNHIRYKSLIPSIIASTVAYFIFCSFFEFTPLIEIDGSSLSPNSINYFFLLPLLIIFGIITGVFILIFITLLRGFTEKLKNFLETRKKLWISPLIGAIGYAILLLITIPFMVEDYRSILIGPDASFLNYFVNIINIIKVNWLTLLILGILFFIGIFLSIGTMNSAGIIMPLMIFGAIIGGLFGVLFYPQNPQLFVLIGISAALGAALKSPIAAIFIIIELTWVPFLIIPASITTVIAYIFSGPSSIIPGQKTVTEMK